MTRRTTTRAFCRCILQIKQVPILISRFSLLPCKHRFSIATSFTSPRNFATQIDLSSINCSGIAQSLTSRCSHLLEKTDKKFGLVKANPFLKDLLLEVSDVVPEYCRRFRRVAELKPKDALELLLGFQSECANIGIEATKVQSLWGIFKWASEQSKSFKHLPRSYELMASILIQAGMLRDFEVLLSSMGNQGLHLHNEEISNNLVKGYVDGGELEKAMLIYDEMKIRGLVPSSSCFRLILDCLVRMKKIQSAYRVCKDMVNMGFCLSEEEKTALESVTRLLCRQGKVQEARNLVKKYAAFDFELNNVVLYDIANGYCEKRDFEDLLSFFIEIKRAPDALAGNRIMHSLCSNCGSERAGLFLRELEHIGFEPDEITFGILIGWSCREGKFRNAFTYLSELLSKCLKPNLHSYNALISGVFKEGISNHARDILDEMLDGGSIPDLSTFRILLAGYCKARQFDEAKAIVCEMESGNLVQLSSQDDPLSKAFTFLGFSPLAVRLKRDNHVGLSKTEFLDILGNGLYLETDLDEYEKKVNRILEDSMLPDFNSLVMERCSKGDLETATRLVDEMVRWGQELSPVCFMNLLKSHCTSASHVKAITGLWKRRPYLIAQLDEGSLNLLVQTYSKKGLTFNGKTIFHEMIQNHVKIKKETYTALINILCKRGNLTDILSYWDTARKDNWVPGLQDCKSLIQCLCKKGKLKELFLLLESMLVSYPHLRLDIIHEFIEKLCFSGSAIVAHALTEELLSLGFVRDQMVYDLLIKGFCKNNNLLAFKILDDILAMNSAPCLSVSVLLIPLLCKAGRHETAIKLKEIVSAEKLHSPLTVYNALIKGYCMTGKVREASTEFQDMLAKCLIPDIETFNLLFQGYCRVKDCERIQELLGAMIRKNISLYVSSYRNLVCLMCIDGNVLQAYRLKALMIGYDVFCDLTIYNILIFHLFSSGNTSLVYEILNEFQEKKLQPDEFTYNFLVYGFCNCKDLSNSTHYLSTMIRKDLRPKDRNLKIVINELCQIGELEKALELNRQMELRGWIHGSTIQNAIVDGLVSHGKFHEAESFLDRMVDKRLVPNDIDYNNLIKQFCRYGKLEKAIDLLNIMLKRGNTPSSSSYDHVIQSFCIVNKLDEAMDFHTEMLDRGLKANTYTSYKLICCLCKNGQTVEAEKLLISMVQVGETPTREMFCSVINRYRIENNLEKASEIMQAMQRSGYEPDFETHWSFISNLSCSANKDDSNGKGFLSKLLSRSGFSQEKDSKAKVGQQHNIIIRTEV